MKIGTPPLTIKVNEIELTPKGTFQGTTTDYQAWSWSRLKDPCAYCGAPGTTNDHIVPRSEGGSEGHSNIARACLDCNMKKGSTPLLLFLLDHLRL